MEEMKKHLSELQLYLDEQISINQILNEENQKLKKDLRVEFIKIQNDKNDSIKKLEDQNNQLKEKIDEYQKKENDFNISIKKHEDQSNQLKEKIDEYQKKENDLNISIKKLEDQNSQLKEEIKEKNDEYQKKENDFNISIKKLEDQNSQLKEEINKMKIENNKEINDLNKKIKDLELKIRELNTDIENLKNEKNKLNDELNKHKKIDEKVKLDKDPLEFYDIIVDINSINGIKKNGWDVLMTEKGKEITEKKKNKSLVIGVIGNRNKGKSFILQALSGEKLQTGTSISTIGLSIKYSNNKFVLLDCAGAESPLLGEHVNMLDISRDKLFTEAFLQNYIIRTCNILLLVIGILSFSEQKLINKISIDLKKLNENNNRKQKNLIIIHNLQTYETKKQVEKYIEEFLLHSATFSVVKDVSNFGQEDIEYFYESENDSIKHFLFAKENSEAGDYYNKRTINAILNMYNIETTKSQYDYKQTLSEHFNYMGGLIFGLKPETELKLDEIYSDDYLPEQNEANLESKSITKEIKEKSNEVEIPTPNVFVNKDLIKFKSKLIYKGEENLVLQKMVIDELGISSFIKNDFTPDYECYYDDNYLTLTIESPEGVILTAKRKQNKNLEYPFCIEVVGEKKEEKKKENVKYLKYKTCGKYYSIIPFQNINSSLGKMEEEEPKNGWKTFKFPITKNVDD